MLFPLRPQFLEPIDEASLYNATEPQTMLGVALYSRAFGTTDQENMNS